MKWRKIEYPHNTFVVGDIDAELPKSGNFCILYNKAEDEVVLGYLWRGDNFRDHNANGKLFCWMPAEELFSPNRWDPTHWMPWPQRPEEVKNVS